MRASTRGRRQAPVFRVPAVSSTATTIPAHPRPLAPLILHLAVPPLALHLFHLARHLPDWVRREVWRRGRQAPAARAAVGAFPQRSDRAAPLLREELDPPVGRPVRAVAFLAAVPVAPGSAVAFAAVVSVPLPLPLSVSVPVSVPLPVSVPGPLIASRAPPVPDPVPLLVLPLPPPSSPLLPLIIRLMLPSPPVPLAPLLVSLPVPVLVPVSVPVPPLAVVLVIIAVATPLPLPLAVVLVFRPMALLASAAGRQRGNGANRRKEEGRKEERTR